MSEQLQQPVTEADLQKTAEAIASEFDRMENAFNQSIIDAFGLDKKGSRNQ